MSDASPSTDPVGGGDSPFAQFVGLEPGELTDEHAVTRLEAQPHHLNPTGAIHGGALMALADTTATRMANHANSGGPNAGRFLVGIDAHATFLGNQPGGVVVAEATPVRVGRRTTVIRTRVTGDGDRLLLELTTTHIPV